MGLQGPDLERHHYFHLFPPLSLSPLSLVQSMIVFLYSFANIIIIPFIYRNVSISLPHCFNPMSYSPSSCYLSLSLCFFLSLPSRIFSKSCSCLELPEHTHFSSRGRLLERTHFSSRGRIRYALSEIGCALILRHP